MGGKAMNTRTVRLRSRHDQVAVIVEGDAVLINFSNGMYYSTRGIGGTLWALIEQQYRLEDIASTIAHRYGVSKRRAQEDVFGFVDSLLNEGLVEPCDHGPDKTGLDAATPSTSYTSPELTAYDDMVEQLALYPPVPNGAQARRASNHQAAGE